jgi:hypothetical protein
MPAVTQAATPLVRQVAQPVVRVVANSPARLAAMLASIPAGSREWLRRASDSGRTAPAGQV